MCRDCLIHPPNATVRKVLLNLERTGARYLLATNSTNVEVNPDIPLGSFRPLNLTKAPFHLPEPLRVIVDGPAESADPNRVLALWSFDQIRRAAR